MDNQATASSAERPNKPEQVTLNFQVIDWRCRNGHLLARVIVGQNKVVFSIKCHRCKHIEEKDVQLLKQ